MSMDFSISKRQLGNVAMISVTGFLDAHTFEELEEAITELFSTGQYRIIVDLSGVDYISSAGAGVFIGALSESQENGGNIVLMNPTANVKEVFDLLGLSQIFSIVADLSKAKEQFA
jgi:anti-sigma B factor antagonist